MWNGSAIRLKCRGAIICSSLIYFSVSSNQYFLSRLADEKYLAKSTQPQTVKFCCMKLLVRGSFVNLPLCPLAILSINIKFYHEGRGEMIGIGLGS